MAYCNNLNRHFKRKKKILNQKYLPCFILNIHAMYTHVHSDLQECFCFFIIFVSFIFLSLHKVMQKDN